MNLAFKKLTKLTARQNAVAYAEITSLKKRPVDVCEQDAHVAQLCAS